MIMNINIISRDQTQVDSFVISDGINDSIISYIVSYSSNTHSNSSTIPVSCMDDSCEYVVDVPSSLCPPLSDINVTVSAANKLGQGPSTDTNTIGIRIYTLLHSCRPYTLI